MTYAHSNTAAITAPPPALPSGFTYSSQQHNVLSWVTDRAAHARHESANVVSRAGTGKTTLLIGIADILAAPENAWLNPRGAFIGAFNKPIAVEIEGKLAARGIDWKKCNAGTWHSKGRSAWKKVAPNAVIDDNKCSKLFDELWPAATEIVKKNQYPQTVLSTVQPIERSFKAFVLKLVSLAKQAGLGPLLHIRDSRNWFDIIEHHDLEFDLEEGQDTVFGIDLAIKLYERSLATCREVIDFNDMILAPLHFKCRFWGHSWILIDEAQDTNACRRALALACLAPGGRLIAVGDPAQAIYGFTGADSDSMDRIARGLNSIVLPLNETFRCPRAVVALAQQWVPDYKSLPNAPEGTYRTIEYKDLTAPGFGGETFLPSDAILCRKSAPLVDLAWNLIKRGVPCRIEGRSIGEGLEKIAKRFKVVTLEAFLRRLAAFQEAEVTKWLAKEKEEKAASIVDSCETLQVIAEGLLSEGKTQVADLLARVEELFTDKKDDPRQVLTLSTIHKSKGREWPRVFILGRNAYQPSKWARKEWQQVAEDNLQYVAVTRAKADLIDIWVEVEAAGNGERGA